MEKPSKERVIFTDIQKKLFYMIPEKWDAIYLYAAIVEEPFKKPVGEMYFYYIPKGILKRKPVNVYQIPGMFNIDEESYNELIQKLFLDIKSLRRVHRNTKPELWTNITISIENFQFKIEYSYEELGKNSEFTPYERHVIWRYKYLHDDSMMQSRDEKNIIERYLNSNLYNSEKESKDIYIEGIYKQQEHNIIDYERTLTIEAAIASQRQENKLANGKKKVKKKKATKEQKQEIEKEPIQTGNQILFSRVEKMKQVEEHRAQERHFEDIDDDMELSSDFMTKKNK